MPLCDCVVEIRAQRVDHQLSEQHVHFCKPCHTLHVLAGKSASRTCNLCVVGHYEFSNVFIVSCCVLLDTMNLEFRF
jgi:hypothetical protein